MDDDVTSKPRRIHSVDQVRGLAVVAMIFSHGLRWLHTGRSQDVIAVASYNSIGDIATPVFFVISGISLGLMALRRGLDLKLLVPKFIRLFIIGLLLTFSWGVLQAQALGLLFVAFVYVMWENRTNRSPGESGSVRGVATVATVCLIIHIAVRETALREFAAKEDAAWDHLLMGGFPIFGVLCLIAFGFLSAKWLQGSNRSLWTLRTGSALLAGGIGLHVLGASLKRAAMSPSFILSGLGLTLVLIGFFEIIQESIGMSLVQRALRLLQATGTHALYLFIFHYIIVALPLHVTGLAGRLNAKHALIGALPLTVAILIGGLKRGIKTPEVYARFDDLLRYFRIPINQSPVSSGPRGRRCHKSTYSGGMR